MIKKIKLSNFLCHSNTSLEFHPGITVFVGHNGSGKSSIIDSITFALFDEHTRKSNKNLLTRGMEGSINNETGSFVTMNLSIGSSDYRVQRQIDMQGRLISARLEQAVKPEKSDKKQVGNNNSNHNEIIYRPIISGERRQLGESVIHEIESIMGMNYSKLQIAGIIQQGEISKIIDSQPKEFKELLNNMIGLDRLDKSFNYMHGIIEEFRKILREKTLGYDDSQIGILRTKIQDNQTKLIRSKDMLRDVSEKIAIKTESLIELDKQIEVLEPKIIKLSEIKSLENTLVKYFKERSNSLNKEIENSSRMIRDIINALDVLKDKEKTLITIQMVGSEKEELNNKINNVVGEIGKLEGFTECAQKIQIIDGKCPVCNSKIISINHMFDISHIKKELTRKKEEKKSLLSEISNLNKEEFDLKKKEREIIAADRTLINYHYDPNINVEKMERNLDRLRKEFHEVSNFSLENLDNVDLSIYKMDDYSTNLIDHIINLREIVYEVDINSFQQKKVLRNNLSKEMIYVHNQKAVLEKTILDMEQENSDFKSLISELQYASSFISDLERIRTTVFNRDGTVSSSLRTRALSLISTKASEYIKVFNVGLSRITLVEKPREIKVICYGKRGEIDTVSLSGGEKVAVSLAIRMGIAFLMGASKMDFIILDEPTTNLDEERRRTFVKIISEVFSKGAGPLNQLIIITHDEEIFENSEIEQVYRFQMTERGSLVTAI
ncbi:MAG TPA: SMC family ATPase [Candidatus Saccharimonadales bacterium]|nr:SMC family ATPase [Candidatus Saccharimonadales bacterium]